MIQTFTFCKIAAGVDEFGHFHNIIGNQMCVESKEYVPCSESARRLEQERGLYQQRNKKSLAQDTNPIVMMMLQIMDAGTVKGFSEVNARFSQVENTPGSIDSKCKAINAVMTPIKKEVKKERQKANN